MDFHRLSWIFMNFHGFSMFKKSSCRSSVGCLGFESFFPGAGDQCLAHQAAGHRRYQDTNTRPGLSLGLRGMEVHRNSGGVVGGMP